MTTRTQKAAALESWSDGVDPADLRVADTESLRAIGDLVEQRNLADEELTEAVRLARSSGRSWSMIAAMLGVSKQAAQQKYGEKAPA